MRKLTKKALFSKFFGVFLLSSLSVFFCLVWLVLLLVYGGSDMPVSFPFVGFVISSLALAYVVYWIKLFRYEINDREVKVEKGVLGKSYDSIPYSRIQNVGIQRSFLERLLGISTVNIHTAGHSGQGSGAEGSIPGLEKDVAEEVRKTIMQKARESDSAVSV